MRIYLVQHGKATSKEEDPDRPLTLEGRSDVRRVAVRLAGAGVDVRRLVHSGKARARQTAEEIADVLGGGASRAVETSGDLGPLDDPSPWADRIEDGEDGVMLVGHLPYMERLAARLVAGDRDTSVVTFRKGGVLCLGREEDEDATAGWTVRWFLTPPLA
jgi:phosphohistidine phosphatase